MIPVVAVLIAAVLGIGLGEASAQTYRWLDAQGNVYYSDRPPQPSTLGDGPESRAARAALLEATVKALTAGQFDRVVDAFRVFEELRSPADVAEGRRLQRLYFRIIADAFGRPAAFTPTTSQALVTLQGVPDRFWEQSDCSVSDHAFTTAFVGRQGRRPAELMVEICYAVGSRRAWLKSLTFTMGPPVQASLGGLSSPPGDEAFNQVMQRFMAAVKESCTRQPHDWC